MIGFGIQIFVCWVLYFCYKSIPQEFRLREPWMVWLLFIPFFHIVWNFYIYPSLATSYKKYFDSIGCTEVGKCGRSVAVAYCVCVCCVFVPSAGPLAALIGIGLLLFFLVEICELKVRVSLSTKSPTTILPPAPPESGKSL